MKTKVAVDKINDFIERYKSFNKFTGYHEEQRYLLLLKSRDVIKADFTSNEMNESVNSLKKLFLSQVFQAYNRLLSFEKNTVQSPSKKSLLLEIDGFFREIQEHDTKNTNTINQSNNQYYYENMAKKIWESVFSLYKYDISQSKYFSVTTLTEIKILKKFYETNSNKFNSLDKSKPNIPVIEIKIDLINLKIKNESKENFIGIFTVLESMLMSSGFINFEYPNKAKAMINQKSKSKFDIFIGWDDVKKDFSSTKIAFSKLKAKIF